MLAPAPISRRRRRTGAAPSRRRRSGRSWSRRRRRSCRWRRARCRGAARRTGRRWRRRRSPRARRGSGPRRALADLDVLQGACRGRSRASPTDVAPSSWTPGEQRDVRREVDGACTQVVAGSRIVTPARIQPCRMRRFISAFKADRWTRSLTPSVCSGRRSRDRRRHAGRGRSPARRSGRAALGVVAGQPPSPSASTSESKT